MSRETWLVTGAAGFIGSNIVKRLLQEGHRVIGVDDFSTGLRDNIALFQDAPLWKLVVMDICDPELATVFDEYKPTHVLHLAAIVSIQYCEEHPERALAVNTEAFREILRLSHTHQVRKVIYASSSAVYGRTEAGAIEESTEVAPISVYGETKVCNEDDARAMNLATGLQCTGLRFFNLFGPHQSATNGYAAVIPLWGAAILRGDRPIIYGDGTATRDFCHIDNVVQSIMLLSQATLTGAKVFNVGTGIATNLNELFATLCDILKTYPEPQYQAWRLADIVHSLADISAIKEACGYEPKVLLKEGLTRLFKGHTHDA